MPSVRSRLDPPDAFARLRRKADAAETITERRARELAKVGEMLLRAAAPQRTGKHRSLVDSEVTGRGRDVTITVWSRSRLRTIIERGRRPGAPMPPPAAIARIFGLPANEAFVVARAIGRRGTPARHPVRRTRAAMRGEVQRTGGRIISDLRKEIT